VCLTLFTLAVAQHDHAAVSRSALSLTQATGNTTFHKEFTGSSANNTIVARSCQYYTHAITNVQTTANTGYYFAIALDVTGLTSGVDVILSDSTGEINYDIAYFSGASASVPGSDYIGSCDGTGCIFEYYCEFYTTTSLLITISTGCNAEGTSTLTTGKYDLRFTEYVETVQTIPASRTLSVGSSTLVVYSVSNPGPKNFAQFYHNLNPTPAESSIVSDLFIEANFTTSGSWLICYNTNYLVNSFAPTTSFQSDIDGSGDSNSCGTVCRQVTGTVVQIQVANSCAFACSTNQDLWIGVAPTGSTSVTTSFTIKLYYATTITGFTLPTITQINSTTYETEGYLTQSGGALCDPAAGDFSCADFYSFTLASIGFSTTNIDKTISPRVIISLYGVLNGVVDLTVQRNAISLNGFDCSCGTSLTCTAGDTTEQECALVIDPCLWSSDYSDEWVISVSTIESNGLYDASYPTTYGLKLEAGSYLSTSVPLSYWITPSRNTLRPEDSHVYKVVIGESDVTPDTIFTAILFSDLAQENLGFYWTTSLSCSSPIFDACSLYSDVDTDSRDSCKFVFTPCSENWVAGTTLYFIVGNYLNALTPYAQQAFQRSVEYTINWKLERASPVYEGITNIETVERYLSAQQYIDVPNDDTISRVRVIISNTRGGRITTFFNIDAFAGSCSDCFTFVDSCDSASDRFQTSDINYDCEFLVSGCHVRGKRIYFATEFDDYYRPAYYGETDPIGYTATVHFDKVTSEPQAIEATRAGAEITSSINRAFSYYYYYNQGLETVDTTRFFKVDFTNSALTENDSLRFTLAFTALYQQQYKPYTGSEYYYMTNSLELVVADTGYAQFHQGYYINQYYDSRLGNCGNVWGCDAATNTYYYETDFSSQQVFSQCSVVIQPCELQSCGSKIGLANVYYITVRNLPDYSEFVSQGSPFTKRSDGGQHLDRFNDVDFNIKVQVISQDPIPLTNNIALTGRIDSQVYAHFKFPLPTQLSANSWFTAMFYINTDQYIKGRDSEGGVLPIYPEVFYYMHFVADKETIVQAGDQIDCYAHDFCYVCSTDSFQPECFYQVSPCDFNQNAGGTYYISAYAASSLSEEELFFNYEADFTLKVQIENIEELLVTNYPPVSSYVYDNTADYYSLTIPTLPSGVSGWVLSLRLEAIKHGDLYISLSDIAPESDCECSKVALEVVEDDIFFARYYPCDVNPGTVLYLSVEGSPDSGVQPVSYTVHAHLDPFTIRDITLNGTLTGQIAQSFDGTFQLSWDEFVSYRFSVNGGAGKMLAVSVSSDNTPDTFLVTLSKGNVSTDSSFGPSSNYIYTGDSVCNGNVDFCSYTNAVGCSLLANDCSVGDSGTETWFLTFDGSKLPNLHRSGNISFKIRVINPSTFTFPNSTTSTVTVTFSTTNTVDNAFNHVNYVSNSVGLSAGNSYTFTLTGNVDVSFNSESCLPLCTVSCIVYGCSDVSAGLWRLSATSSGSVAITLGTTNYGNTTVTSIPANGVTPFTVPSITSDHWAYYSIQAPATTTGSFSLTTSFNPADIIYISSPQAFIFPRFPSSSLDTKGLSNSGVFEDSCGPTTTGFLSATCCYDAFTEVFAIQPSATTGGTVTFTTTQFVETSLGTQSTPFTLSQTLAEEKVDVIPFTVAVNTDIWLSISTNTTNALLIYLNRGSPAGAQGGSLANQCWNNFYSGSDICPQAITSTSPCKAFIDVCETCFGESSSQTYYLSVYNSIGSGIASYTVTIATQSAFDTVTANTAASLRFPSPTGSISIVDSRTSGSAFLVYTHFIFDYSQLIVNDAVNFVPVVGDLNIGSALNFPRVFFNLNSIRYANGTALTPALTASARVIDLFVTKSGICNDSPASIPGASLCMESGGGLYLDGQFNCSISVCDLQCGTIYWSVRRSSSDSSSDQYSFNFVGTEQYNGINVVSPPIRIVEIDIGTSGSNFLALNSTAQTITYYKVNLGSQFALNDNTKRFTDFTFAFASTSGAGTLDVSSYAAECVTSASSGTSLTSGNSVVFTNEPTDFEDIYGNSVSSVFYYRVAFNGAGASTYNVTLNWNTTTVSVIPVTVDPEVEYVATKEIYDLDWHFFEFSVPLNGYYNLHLSLSSLCCSSASGNLEIFTSFDGSEISDAARPNRYPDHVHYENSYTLSTGSVDISIPLTCDNYGGIYRVSVFADLGTQFSSLYPAIYDIQAYLLEDVHVKLNLGCLYTTSTVALFEIEPEANNRGSYLAVYARSSSGVNLLVSGNGRPYDSGRCDWTEGDGYVQDYQDYQDISFSSTTASVVIPYCEYTNDKWFVVVGYSGVLNIGTVFIREYIPTVTPAPVYTTSADLYPGNIQYFKVNVPGSKYSGFRAAIEECGSTGLELYVSGGDTGFSSFGGSWIEKACNAGDNCYDSYCKSIPNNGISTCAVAFDQYCGANAVYFIGVYNPTSSVHTYTLQITADFKDEVIPVYLGVPNCFAINCFARFQVLNADGTSPAISSLSDVKVTINNPTSSTFDAYVSTSSLATANCYDQYEDCSGGCSFDYCSSGSDLFIYVVSTEVSSTLGESPFATCPASCSSELIISITASFTTSSVTALTLGGTASTSAFSSFTLASTGQSVAINAASPGHTKDSFCAENSKDTCSVLYPDTVDHTYFFYSSGVSLSSPQVNALTTTPTSYELVPSVGFLHFSYTPSANKRIVSLDFSNINYCVLDLVSGSLPVYVHYHADYVPFTNCAKCASGDQLTFASCDVDGVSYSTPTCEAGTVYFSICSSVPDFVCPLSFQVSVTEEDIVAIGSSHLESNFVHVSQSVDDALCESSLSYSYYVDVTGPLFVGIREAVGATVTVTVSSPDSDSSCSTLGSCVATDGYSTDSFSACGVSTCDHCVSSGRYLLDVQVSSIDDLGYSFDIIAINQYLPLTAPVQTTIGVLKHFYSYSATAFQSLVFKLTVQTGPALELYVFEGCDSASTSFSESVVCAFDDCYVYVPSQAKRSAAATYYIVLTSSTYGESGTPFLERNSATDSVKATSYALAVTAGTQNCVSASSLNSLAPFCNSTFKDISSVSVWSFADVPSKDAEAKCLYNNLASQIQCPQATNDCLQWLKTLSCLITFPQCDSNGFQQGVCRQVCNLVDNYCGIDWEAQFTSSFAFSPYTAYDCASAFYVDSNSSTCYPIPTPPPPPSTVDDYNPVSAGPAVLEPFDVPVFSDVTIYLTTGEFATYSIFTSGGGGSGTFDSTLTASEISSLFTSNVFGSASTLCSGIFAFVFLILML